MKRLYAVAAIAVMVCLISVPVLAQQPTWIDSGNSNDGLYTKMKAALKDPHAHISEQSEPTSYQGVVAGMKELPTYPKFISYPTSHQKPTLIPNEDMETAKLVHGWQLQHWYFIFDQTGYVNRYGPLPQNLPGGMTAEQYAAHPPASAFNEDLDRYYLEQEQKAPAGDPR